MTLERMLMMLELQEIDCKIHKADEIDGKFLELEAKILLILLKE